MLDPGLYIKNSILWLKILLNIAATTTIPPEEVFDVSVCVCVGGGGGRVQVFPVC